jgi:hypothetical protein
MTNNENAYDGYTPSKDVEQQRTEIPKDLPGGKNSQWENLARTHAEHEREYYSLRSILKRWAPSGEIGWVPGVGIMVLIFVLVAFNMAT